MGSELVTAKSLAASLQEKVEHKIRDAFIDLVTDEQWREMTAAALKRFTEPVRVPRTYNRGAYDKPSPFDEIVNEVVSQRLRERLTEELAKPEYFSTDWCERAGVMMPTPGDAVKEMVKELAPELVLALFQGVVHEAVERMRTAFGST